MKRPRLFTSHFILLPDGSLGKWPVVELGPDGSILSLELHPEGLRERPGMELLGGLLLPGLLDVAGCSASYVFNNRDLNRHYAWGTCVLGGLTDQVGAARETKVIRGLDVELQVRPVLQRPLDFQVPLLLRLDRYMALNPEGDWLGILHAATTLAAEAAGLELGRMEVGARPGCLLLKGLDLGAMQWRPGVKALWCS